MTAPYGPPEQPGYGPPPVGPPGGYGASGSYGASGGQGAYSGYGASGGYPAGYGVHPAGYGGPAGPPRPGGRAANPAGISIALLGGIAVLLGAFRDWYTNVVLGDIVNALDVDGAKAFPKAYFGWLMWVLLAATVVAALFANLPIGASAALRVVSPVLGALGAVLVFVSLNELVERGSVFDHSSGGLYLTLIGFLVAGVGGVLGPRRA